MRHPDSRSPRTDGLDQDRRHSGSMPDPGDVAVGPDGGSVLRDGGTEPWVRRLMVWRSPADQPRWARPILLVLAAVAGVAYGWRMGSSIEIYYAAAVRSMSVSWHDFAYGAFDPAGTISVDKLPGALWFQTLSVRLFGFHTWAIALPQVVEGALTILVLYRVVRRLAGAQAAIVAAAVLAVSPAAVTLDRGNISDTLLILLLVLAADALAGSLLTGNRRGVLLAGLWVGLAFQAKMIEAWLVIPALAITYLVASGGTLRTRLLRLAAMVAVIAVVSLSWMSFVSLTPASHRPYVDGSLHDSIFEQVFDYNGLGRVGQPSPNAELGHTLGIPILSAPGPRPAWNRLLRGPYGRDIGWLLPAALAMVPLGLAARWRRPRTDLVRAGVVLWGSWLIILTVVFSASATVISYYLAALAPPIAALVGIGGSLAWQHRRSTLTQAVVVGVVVLTTRYGYWLLPSSGTGLPEWVAPGPLGSRHPGGCLCDDNNVPAPRPCRVDDRCGSCRCGPCGHPACSVGGIGVRRRKQAGTVRHAVSTGGRDRLHPVILRCAVEAAVHAPEDRGGEERCARPHGHPDVGAGSAAHLRHRRGGPADRRLHGDDPGTHGGRRALDGGRRHVPSGPGCRPQPGPAGSLDCTPLPTSADASQPGQRRRPARHFLLRPTAIGEGGGLEWATQLGRDLQDTDCPVEAGSLGSTLIRRKKEIAAWHQSYLSNGPTQVEL